jgi:hypothetical protein
MLKKKRQMINEHDITKSMLDTLRSKNLITENEEIGETKELVLFSSGKEVTNGDPSLSGFWDTEKETFMDQVTPSVTFESFVITPKSENNDGNVSLKFKLTDSDIFFDMNSAKQLGLVMNANTAEVDDTTFNQISKVFKYYTNWTTDWQKKLNTENFG